MSQVSSDSESVGQLCCPWSRVQLQFFNPEKISLFAILNYKVYANVGFTRRETVRYAVILETGAGLNFICKYFIPQLKWSWIKHPRYDVRIKDADNHRVNRSGTIDFSVEVGSHVAIVKFFVVDKLGADVSLGRDFCDKHVEAIRPWQRAVEFDDGTSVPSCEMHTPVLGPKYQFWSRKYMRTKTDDQPIVSSQPKTPYSHPKVKNCVKLKMGQAGLIMFESLPRLYDIHNCLAVAGVYQAIPGKEFGILIANLSSKPVYITEGQAVAKAAEHPVALMEITVTHGEMLGVVETQNVYKKRDKSTRDIDVINKHLADALEAAVRKADETIDADNVKLGVDDIHHPEIFKMPRKHNEVCSGRLRNDNITQIRFYLIPEPPFQICSLPSRSEDTQTLTVRNRQAAQG